MAICSQCGKRPAIYDVSGHLLCLSCDALMDEVNEREFRRAAAMLNLVAQEFDSVAGIPGLAPRIQLPPQPARKGDLTVNAINVANSVVGAINTGHIDELKVSLQHIHNAGGKRAAAALAEFTDGLVRSKEVEAAKRDEILEHLAFIGSQLAESNAKRKPTLLRRSLSAVKEAVANTANLAQLYDAFFTYIQPMLASAPT